MPTPALTDEQFQEALNLYDEHGTEYAAADALGISRPAFANRLRKARAWRDAPDGQRLAILHSGLSIDTAKAGWRKIKNADGTSDSVYWRAPNEPETDRTVEALRSGLEAIAPAPYVPTPNAPDGLCAVFPVADLHMGMLADEEEVGENWDGKKAGKAFQETFGRLVSVTPAAGVAVLAQLGDLMHVDDQRNVTPQSGHQLDADTRYFMILRRAVAVMKWGIDELRQKYPKVIYRGVRGNHDMTAHYAVTLALAEHYKDTIGVEIVDNAGEFYVYEFGVNMVLLHHGDKAKPERLVHFAAAEWPEMWGRTKHRIALSGHVHHETRKEIGGMCFESVGTIIPRDVHAYSHAYSAKRSLVSITLDEKDGEISRAKVGAG
jgi:predicted phosphodiesterase